MYRFCHSDGAELTVGIYACIDLKTLPDTYDGYSECRVRHWLKGEHMLKSDTHTKTNHASE